MSTRLFTDTWRRFSFLCALACLSFLSGVAQAQGPQNQPEKLAYGVDRSNIPDAISKVKSGEFGAIHVDLIARANAVEAVPALKEQFGRTEDPILKAKIASALVKLGDHSETYWEYVFNLATKAVESDAPDFTTPDFEKWVQARGLSPAETEEQMYLLSGAVAMLASTGDPKAVPVLRRALDSPNHLTKIMGAMGLAELGDTASIPLIIEACKNSPPELAAVIARALVYFDDTTAQAAVDQYIPKDLAKMYREAKAHGNTKPLSPPLYDRPPSQ